MKKFFNWIKSKLKRKDKIKHKRSWRNIALGLFFIILSLSLLAGQLILDIYWTEERIAVRQFVFSVISSLISVFGLGAFWEWFGKITFSRQLLEDIKMADNVIASGAFDYYSFYSIPWKELLKGVKEVKIFLTFGSSWAKYNRSTLADFIKSGKKLTVIFPNPEKKEICEYLLNLYPNDDGDNNTTDKIKSNIKKSASVFKSLGAKVKIYDKIPQSSYYFLDDTCFISPYPHSPNICDIPALRLKGGDFYKFCREDMNQILKNSDDFIPDD